jgi:hypothetical protein
MAVDVGGVPREPGLGSGATRVRPNLGIANHLVIKSTAPGVSPVGRNDMHEQLPKGLNTLDFSFETVYHSRHSVRQHRKMKKTSDHQTLV